MNANPILDFGIDKASLKYTGQLNTLFLYERFRDPALTGYLHC